MSEENKGKYEEEKKMCNTKRQRLKPEENKQKKIEGIKGK